MTEKHLPETYRCDVDDEGSIVLVVTMRGTYGTESLGAHWHWEPDYWHLEVEGAETEPSVWIDRMVRRYWPELPGMPEALQRWERGKR